MAKAESEDLDAFLGFASDFVTDLGEPERGKSHCLHHAKGPACYPERAAPLQLRIV